MDHLKKTVCNFKIQAPVLTIDERSLMSYKNSLSFYCMYQIIKWWYLPMKS